MTSVLCLIDKYSTVNVIKLILSKQKENES